MNYNLTEKLNFDSNPVITINRGNETIELELDASAVTCLKAMETVENESEVRAAMKCAELLIKDYDKFQSLNLSLADYITVVKYALSLVMGADPDEEVGE